MAVKIEITGDNAATVTSTDPNNVSEVVVTSSVLEVANTAGPVTVIEQTKGIPGDQRVFAGDTPPDNPKEGWIWIDTSG